MSDRLPPRDEHSAPDAPQQAIEHHLLMQAPVSAVDADGLNVVSVVTVMFAVGAVILALDYPALQAEGHGWWLSVAVSGLILGLVGLAYCWNRRRQRQAGRWDRD